MIIHLYHHFDTEVIKQMATELETLAANLTKVKGDVESLVGVVGTLKTQITDLTTQLAAAKAAGFDVPDDLMTQSSDLVTEADKAVADASTTSVVVTDPANP